MCSAIIIIIIIFIIITHQLQCVHPSMLCVIIPF